jgi:hypothetical protein
MELAKVHSLLQTHVSVMPNLLVLLCYQKFVHQQNVPQDNTSANMWWAEHGQDHAHYPALLITMNCHIQLQISSIYFQSWFVVM